MASEGEELFAFHCGLYKIEVEREYAFWPGRRWRFDFAIPAKKIAIEVEGGTFSGGRHTRGTGYEKDCEKYNHAALAGWRVFRFTTGMVKNGMAIGMIVEAVN